MVENTEKPAEEALATNVEKDARPASRGWGWRIHNEITYRGINWLLNSTIGVAFTYWTVKTESGVRKFSQPVTHFFEERLKSYFKKPENLAEGVSWGTRLLTIMIGGFTIIPLMILMENKTVKKNVVRWLDEKIYGRDEVKNNPAFEESYKKIDEEPRKGFWRGMFARAIALSPLFVICFNSELNKWPARFLYNPLGKMTKWTAEKCGIKPASMIAKTQMVHPDGNTSLSKVPQSNWDYLHQTIGFDFGLTAFYAVLHEIAYKTLASFGAKNIKSAKASESTESKKTAPLPQEMSEYKITPKATKFRPEKNENFVQAVDKSRKYNDLAMIPV